MAEYSVPQNEPRRFEPVGTNVSGTGTSETTSVAPAIHVASPAPLGLGVIGIITAILGCFYTGFIIPYQAASMRPAVGVASLVLGIILVLAGMWEFRKSYVMTATLFTAYGGVLALLGMIFMSSSILPAAGADVNFLLALIFLCWTIYLGVLCLGATRTNASLLITMLCLFVGFFFLMLGSFISNNGILIRIGGWFAIATAVLAWIASLASILGTDVHNELYRIPFGQRLAVVEH